MKRYFHALRPALCVRLLRFDPSCRTPMPIWAHLHAGDLAQSLYQQIDEPIARKTLTRGTGTTYCLPDVERFILK
ncbi:hypothetical protein ACFO0A_13015 [Novosphingobium tardum]|uniref:Uncharacterized protein n=1 Tax=Novosphingobium tardum TaxID=1538021 RepID=A0ABV8RTH0_9SPHN